MAVLPAGQIMWIAYPGEIHRVRIVEKGARDIVFKRGAKPRDPYIVFDEVEDAEFVMASADLHHNPRDARVEAAELGGDEPDDADEREENPTEDDEDEGDDGDDEDEDEDEYDEVPL